MKLEHRFNLAVNEVAKRFGLMILFRGWLPTRVVKRPNFIRFGDPKIEEE